MSNVTKSRLHGFHALVDSEDMFVRPLVHVSRSAHRALNRVVRRVCYIMCKGMAHRPSPNGKT